MKLSEILFEEFVPSTEENVEKAKAFIKQKWNERAKEYGREEPTDLSGACKFASMFAKLVFGGELRGNKLHQFVELDNRLIDLTAGSSDVVLMKEPYKHDKRFWNNPEHKRSMQSCEPRAKQWAEEFVRLYQNEVI
jgi:hypothetical protein